MSKAIIFDFLNQLKYNNSKAWMDENRSFYHDAKAIWVEEVGKILHRLAKYQPELELVQPKSILSRINNNRRFHPNKPVYKTFFTASPLGGLGTASFHISVGVEDGSGFPASFGGGGLYRPEKEALDKLREAIDYDGQEITTLLEAPKFQDFFGGLSEDSEALKTAPQNYDRTHPYIHLIRRKNFAAIKPLQQEQVISDNFVNLIEEAYLSLEPFLDYINKALNYSETA